MITDMDRGREQKRETEAKDRSSGTTMTRDMKQKCETEIETTEHKER